MPTTAEQRVKNLKEANRIRLLRAQLRGEMKQIGGAQARFLLADSIERMPDFLECADVHWLLTLCPYRGPLKAEVWADRLLWGLGVTRGPRRLRDLTRRQRDLLASALRSGTQHGSVEVTAA